MTEKSWIFHTVNCRPAKHTRNRIGNTVCPSASSTNPYSKQHYQFIVYQASAICICFCKTLCIVGLINCETLMHNPNSKLPILHFAYDPWNQIKGFQICQWMHQNWCKWIWDGLMFLHGVEIQEFFYQSDFTWNQFQGLHFD